MVLFMYFKNPNLNILIIGVNGMFVNNENEGQYSIDIRDIIKILMKRIKLLLIVPVLFSIIGCLVSMYLINPVYEAATTLIVWQKKDSTILSQGDINLSKSLILTYAEIARSTIVFENTKKALNINELNRQAITITPVEDTQIIKVKVQNEDAEMAMRVANIFAEKFTDEVLRITSTDNVAVVDLAKFPKEPVIPNIALNTVISGMLGEMIILLIVFLIEYFDNTTKTERDIENYLKTSLLGTIPNFSIGRNELYESEKIYSEGTS